MDILFVVGFFSVLWLFASGLRLLFGARFSLFLKRLLFAALTLVFLFQSSSLFFLVLLCLVCCRSGKSNAPCGFMTETSDDVLEGRRVVYPVLTSLHTERLNNVYFG